MCHRSDCDLLYAFEAVLGSAVDGERIRVEFQDRLESEGQDIHNEGPNRGAAL